MRIRIRNILPLLLAATLMVACGGGQKTPEPSASVDQNLAPPVPDVGGVKRIEVTTSGRGASEPEALSEAMKLAILEVNGAVVDTASLTMKFGLDVTNGVDTASLRGSAFADLVAQRSGGVIQSLKVVDVKQPRLGQKLYTVTITASIAKFEQSAEMQRIRVVVATPQFIEAALPMGDKTIPSSELAETLRQRITDALTQTGRFAVLDREASPELDRELAMISEGSAPSEELAKLGQAVSADVLLTTRVDRMAYNRHARQLRTSDRELVSYDGGWAITHKLVNVATRQVTASGSLSGDAPATEPTTLSSGVDSNKVLQDMTDAMVKELVASVMKRTFPVSIVARDGTDVVLSQGGQSLREGARYTVNRLGNELKDPQTGQSLGRVESPCCELVITRVAENLSYGRLENVKAALDNLPTGALVVGDLMTNVVAANSQPSVPVIDSSVATSVTADSTPIGRAEIDIPEVSASKEEVQDTKW